MFNVNPNAFIFPGQAKPEDFETSIRELKDPSRPNLTIYIKYEIE